MVVDFSKINLKERPMLVLKTQSDEVIQTLGYAFNVEADLMYNEVSTLTFDLPAYVNGVKTPNYDEVKGARIVDFVGVGLFILVDPTSENDGVSEIKHCKAYSLEYEFTKKQFYIAGNEDDVDEDGNIGYKMVYKFYDSTSGADNKETIIGRIKEKMPEWTFDVDSELWDKYRTFDSDVSDNVYNFIKSTVQESYGCIFDFDTYTRTVHVISTESVIPQREVYLSQNNLIKNINIDEDSDSIVTCLDVSGEEGVSIRFVNPTGQNNIYDLHYFEGELSGPLWNKWSEWVNDCDSKRQTYFNLAMSYQVKAAEVLTEEVKLVELQGEKQKAVTLQGTIVSKSDATKAELESAKNAVEAAQQEVETQQGVVDAKSAEKESIYDSLIAINNSLAWEATEKNPHPWKDSHGNSFTAKELATLRRYFYEDSLEDSSFALATTTSYTNKDVGSNLNNLTIDITESTVERPTSTSPLYSFAGGELKMSTLLTAKIVRGTASIDPSGKNVILTAYLERGDYSQSEFEDDGTGRTIFDCGTITMTGTYTGTSYNGRAGEDGIYSGTRLSLTGVSGRVYFTRDTTEYEQYSVEWDLFNYGQQVLKEKSEPSYTFTVESGNFMALDDFFAFKNELMLGQRVYLNLDDTLKAPFVTSVHINYENLSDFTIEFCNTYRTSDSSFRLGQLLEQSVRMGKSLNIKGGMYSQFQATGAKDAVKDFMNSALDIAKNNVLSSENQAITFDESGLRLRKWTDASKRAYDDEQIWMNDNTIAFTDDGWSTTKMAIGKIFDPNISETGEAYGIAAPYLVGTILAGSNLVITSKGPDGTGDTLFRIDGSGIRIKTSSLVITNNKGTEGKTFEDTQKDTKDAAVEEAGTNARAYTNSQFDEFMAIYDHGDDKVITTFYGELEPLEAEVGDLWYFDNTITIPKIGSTETDRVGTLKRCTESYITGDAGRKIESFVTMSKDRYDYEKSKDRIKGSTVYYVITYDATNVVTARSIYQGQTNKSTWRKTVNWELVQDEDAIKAVASAADAKFIADNKINTFYSTTAPKGVVDESGDVLIPVGEGDLWYKLPPEPRADYVGKTDPTDKCQYGKMYWYDGSAWKMVQDISIDAINSTLSDYWAEISSLMDRMDSKMNTFYMDAMPTITENDLENKDLFFYTGSTDLNTTYPVTTGSETTHVFKPSHLYQAEISEHDGVMTIDGWTEIVDQKVVDAIAAAEAAQNTADKKASTYARPTIPGTQTGDEDIDSLDNGDLWFNTHNSADGGFWYPSQSATNAVFYRDGKLYRYEHREGYPGWSNWVLMEDADIDLKATMIGKKMRELMRILNANDNDMNIFELKQSDNFDTITSGAEDGDLLLYVGTSARNVTVNGKSVSLTPKGLYRITVTGNKITALTEETDQDAKDAIEAARSFQNYTDNKSTVYAQATVPSRSGMDAKDNGDIWIVTADIAGTDYKKDETYRYEHPNWIRIEDRTIGELRDYFDTVSDNLTRQINKKVSTYYSATVPTDAQDGDLLYYVGGDVQVGDATLTSRHFYRCKVNGGTQRWQLLSDQDALDAMQRAADANAMATSAKNLADGKATVHWSSTVPDTPENSEGDLWYNTATSGPSGYEPGRLYCCVKDGENRNWVLLEDLKLKEDMQAKYGDTTRGLLLAFDVLDKKINVFSMSTMPTVADNGLENNDLFVNTGAAQINVTIDGKAYALMPNTVYRAIVDETGTTNVLKGWEEVTNESDIPVILESAKGAKNTIDKKITTYVQDYIPGEGTGETPLGEADEGDIWFNTATDDIIGRDGVTYQAGETYTFSNLSGALKWQRVSSYTEIADEFFAVNQSLLELDRQTKKKSTTYYSDTVPTDAQDGDLLYYTGGTNTVSGIVIRSSAVYSSSSRCKINATGNALVVETREVKSSSITPIRTTVYEGNRWLYEQLYLEQFGTVDSVDKSSPYYPLITADFTDDGYVVRRTIQVGDDLNGKDIYFRHSAVQFISGHLYRYHQDETDPQNKWWAEITDANAVKAIKDAANAFNLADKKAQTFLDTEPPTPETNGEGDLWYCTKAEGQGGTSTLVAEAADSEQSGWNYFGGRLYYCVEVNNVLKWKLCEDKGLVKQIADAKTEAISEIKEHYQNVTDGTELVASAIKGTIKAQYANMLSSNSKLELNDYGYWLRDLTADPTADPPKVPKAIWFGSEGILFGHEAQTNESRPDTMTETDAGVNQAMGLTNKKWYWTTAINHDGITAQALAAKELMGVNITGQSKLQIGSKGSGNNIYYNFVVNKDNDKKLKFGTSNGTDYNFVVNENGSVEIKGTVYADDLRLKYGNGFSQTSIIDSNGKIDGDYLNVKQLDIRDNNNNVVISANSGGITLKSGAISWSSIDTSDADYLTDNDLNNYALKTYVSTAVTNAKNEIISPNGTTFIDGRKIYSPEIYSNAFSVYPENGSSSGQGSFDIYGDYGNSRYHVFTIKYRISNDPNINLYMPSGGTLSIGKINNVTSFVGQVSFSDAEVTGLSNTATFG